MRIAVTDGAGHVFKPIRVRVTFRTALVTIYAHDRCVRPLQCETRVTMTRQRERRSLKTVNRVTGVTLIGKLLLKLSRVSILVAVRAHCKTRVIVGHSPVFHVTLFACHHHVFSSQWIQRELVGFRIVS